MGEKAPDAQLIKLNSKLAAQLGLDTQSLSEQQIAAMFAGGLSIKGADSVSQVYAGHQFGHFNPQLGDGRALLLGEVIDKRGERLDIHLKGSGRTPFSRRGDGKAVLGPVLREYLLAEAMHHLNVPTTRALAAVTTGERIMRDQLLPGAVIARVAKSHIRVGTFQFFAARGDNASVKRLADYCVERHFPEILQSNYTGPANNYLALLEKVCQRQAVLVAKWMSIGFVHGVMNTDNCTISGETIDYGPCAFLDQYDPEQVFSSIDHQGRYAYQNQPSIAKWNMARFAETLLPFIDADEDKAVELATYAIEQFDTFYRESWRELMGAKLGLLDISAEDDGLIEQLLNLLAHYQLDYCQLFRALATSVTGDLTKIRELIPQITDEGFAAFSDWYQRWQERLTKQSSSPHQIIELMNRTNPVYIPRNHLVEQVISLAQEKGDFGEFEKLLSILENPFKERAELNHYAQPAPKSFGCYTTFCGT